MQKYGQLNLFPVKLQVPIIFTVYLVLVNKCGCRTFACRQLLPRACSVASFAANMLTHCVSVLVTVQ
jgi:hypothetical protein